MDDEAVESDQAIVTTEVTLPPAPESEVVDTPDVNVVVVEASPESAPDNTAVNHEGRIVRIETAIEELAALVTANIAATAQASETANVALEIAVEEEPEPEPEPDRSPEKPHFMHRPFRELIGKK